MQVVFTPQARADYIEAVDWYACLSPALGQRLRAMFRLIRQRLAENPHQFPVLKMDLRRALLRDFPYAVIFRILDTRVVIIAFFHTSRGPRQWQGRL